MEVASKEDVCLSMVNGPDILLAASSEDILSSMMCGSLRAEGRFVGKKVCCSGGGLPIWEP